MKHLKKSDTLASIPTITVSKGNLVVSKLVICHQQTLLKSLEKNQDTGAHLHFNQDSFDLYGAYCMSFKSLNKDSIKPLGEKSLKVEPVLPACHRTLCVYSMYSFRPVLFGEQRYFEM